MTEHLAALNAGHDMDFWGNKNPKCPHCGLDCRITDLEWYDLYEEGEHLKECPSCGLDFKVSVTVTHSFSTDEQDDGS